MAQLKAARAADVPTAAAVPEIGGAQLGLASASCISGADRPPLVVIGHRGNGMNALLEAAGDGEVCRENTLRSFSHAARCPGVSFVEFDVQVTKDGCPVIFHDTFIYTTEQDGEISEKRVTDLSLDEFLSYGPQKDHTKAAPAKPLLRKLRDGRIVWWDVRSDDALCTLREAFQGVHRRVGFNVELKFDDAAAYTHHGLTQTLQAVLQVVFEHANGRPVIFSSFHPDAALLMRKLQDKYPVYFLTKGGTEVFADPRRNSLEEAVRLCLAGGLQGVVSEVRAILRQPSAVALIKDARLSLLTYGQLNNVPEVVYVQHLMGVDGVIVDRVQEIADAVSAFTAAPPEDASEGQKTAAAPPTPTFSQREISFLLRLIPELVQ